MNIQQMLRDLAIKQPKAIIEQLKAVVPEHALNKIEVYQQDQTLLLISDPAWLSWLKLNRQRIKQVLPKTLSIKILAKHHLPLTRSEPEAINKRTMVADDAIALQHIGAHCGHEGLHKAIEKLVGRHLKSD